MRRAASRTRSERGSTLAALAVVIAIMSIMLTVAAQDWKFMHQRDKEKELIFRGERILAAIEEFQSTGRSITKLEDLTKAPKPALRRVPPDPMTARFDEDGKLVPGTGEWRILRPNRPPPQPTPSGEQDRPQPEEEQPRVAVETGPISGVASRSDEESIGAYGEIPAGSSYTQWTFETTVMRTSGIITNRQRPERPLPPGFAGLRLPGGPPVQATPQPQSMQPQMPAAGQGGPRMGGSPSQGRGGPPSPRPPGRRP